MNEYIEQLKMKFGYSEELASFLEKLIPSLIIYYGEEYKDLILTALYNSEIHFQNKTENTEEYLNAYFGINKEWKIPTLGGAFYHNEISAVNNSIVSKPIIYVKYYPFDFTDDKKVNTLVHEICHLIKGYGKTKIENGKIVDYTGLIKDTYYFSADTGLIEEKSDNIGIEEAINEVDTVKILELMTGRKQEISGYVTAGNFALALMENDDIAKVIKISQLENNDSWIQYFGETNSKFLVENFDILVKSMYVSYSEINTKEKREALKQKTMFARNNIEEFIENNLHTKKSVI